MVIDSCISHQKNLLVSNIFQYAYFERVHTQPNVKTKCIKLHSIEEGGINFQSIDYSVVPENVEALDIDFQLRAFLFRELTLCKENFMTHPGFTMKDIHDMISYISIY